MDAKNANLEIRIWRSASLRASLRRKEGVVSLLTRHLFLSAQARLVNMPGYYHASREARDWIAMSVDGICHSEWSEESALMFDPEAAAEQIPHRFRFGQPQRRVRDDTLEKDAAQWIGNILCSSSVN